MELGLASGMDTTNWKLTRRDGTPAGVTVRAVQAGEVEDWLAAHIEKIKAETNHRRHGHRASAAKASHAMRQRGETVAGPGHQPNCR